MKKPSTSPHPLWIRFFLFLDLLGLVVFLLGIRPATFGLDRSLVIGYLQVIVFLFGLGLVVVSTYSIENLSRPSGRPLTFREDIGTRLAATGYVLAVFSSIADLIGLGTNPLPGSPNFGLLQSAGLLLGTLMAILGLFLYYPLRRKLDRINISNEVPGKETGG